MRKLLLAVMCITGCVHASDVDIRHPLVARQVDPNRIVKPHDAATRSNGLPYGTLNDEGVLLSLDPQQACFDVTLRELHPIDLAASQPSLGTPGMGPLTNAQVWPEQPEVTPMNAVVSQQVFGPRQAYETETVPGRVDVYRSHARICFAHAGAITPASEQLELILRGGGKKMAFRWGVVTDWLIRESNETTSGFMPLSGRCGEGRRGRA
jgi:hypothetical protein